MLDNSKSIRQEEGISIWKANGFQGTLQYVMRFGKTRIIELIVQRTRQKECNINKRIIVLTPTDIASKNVSYICKNYDCESYTITALNNAINQGLNTEGYLLIIDEIHHVLAGTLAKQRLFLNVLKYLSNELQIPLICAGTRDAFNAIQTDPQLSNRFEPKVLPRWTNDTELKRLLISFESILPLKKESNLIENSITNKILAMSDGLIGEISKIIELSTILAIESKIEKITPNILESIDYTSPDKRKKFLI